MNRRGFLGALAAVVAAPAVASKQEHETVETTPFYNPNPYIHGEVPVRYFKIAEDLYHMSPVPRADGAVGWRMYRSI